MSNLEPESALVTSTGLFLANYGEKFKGRLLDVGCGSKPYKGMYDDRVTEWLGVDNRPVGDVVADAHQLPFQDGEFDTVLCTNLLHYLVVPSQAIAEMARVLKPGGTLLLAAAMNYPDVEGVFYTFHPASLNFLLNAAGLKPEIIMRDGRLMNAEWSALTGYNKWNMAIPVNIGSWVDGMDRRYPCLVGAVATKEG